MGGGEWWSEATGGNLTNSWPLFVATKQTRGQIAPLWNKANCAADSSPQLDQSSVPFAFTSFQYLDRNVKRDSQKSFVTQKALVYGRIPSLNCLLWILFTVYFTFLLFLLICLNYMYCISSLVIPSSSKFSSNYTQLYLRPYCMSQS